MKLSRRERERLDENSISNEQGSQPQSPPLSFSAKPNVHKKHIILGSIILFVLGISIYSLVAYSRPGTYDDFAKCLTEKGAVMYGALSWCKYTQGQKAMFGKSFKYVNYHEFQELPGIKKTPTWVINGRWYENTQSFESLAQATGCKI
ncbi:hypothetical protein HYT54_03490 [Candidatus Woesearchaeota archaeon]|nr:hypothetical protein [Candidatus Woesearchaeota archaeon]